jgi:hypothetical protein
LIGFLFRHLNIYAQSRLTFGSLIATPPPLVFSIYFVEVSTSALPLTGYSLIVLGFRLLNSALTFYLNVIGIGLIFGSTWI